MALKKVLAMKNTCYKAGFTKPNNLTAPPLHKFGDVDMPPFFYE